MGILDLLDDGRFDHCDQCLIVTNSRQLVVIWLWAQGPSTPGQHYANEQISQAVGPTTHFVNGWLQTHRRFSPNVTTTVATNNNECMQELNHQQKNISS